MQRTHESSLRYMDHLSRGQVLFAESGFAAPPLQGKRRAQANHRQAKLRRTALPAWENALAKYGSQFARAWHPESLAARAEKHDLGDFYDAYRLASNVAHGSSAGSIGNFHINQQGAGSFSMGRNVDLVPLALTVGAEAQFRLLMRLADADSSLPLDDLLSFLSSELIAISVKSRLVV